MVLFVKKEPNKITVVGYTNDHYHAVEGMANHNHTPEHGWTGPHTPVGMDISEAVTDMWNDGVFE